MTKQELVMELRRIYWVEVEEREQQDEFGAMANYILDNFVPTEKVQDREVDLQNLLNEHWEDVIKRDYISKEEHNKAILEISRLKEIETLHDLIDKDSKPRECDVTSKDATTKTPPSICQHEWGFRNGAAYRAKHESCLKCGISKPYEPVVLPDVPEKITIYGTPQDDIGHAVLTLGQKVNTLCDCYSALKKVVEEKL